uniref:Uncharacterized protein n=1 Tax=Trichogramma kaykai TaxID=54128 RepID=A0ABD2XJ75_9HYME
MAHMSYFWKKYVISSVALVESKLDCASSLLRAIDALSSAIALRTLAADDKSAIYSRATSKSQERRSQNNSLYASSLLHSLVARCTRFVAFALKYIPMYICTRWRLRRRRRRRRAASSLAAAAPGASLAGTRRRVQEYRVLDFCLRPLAKAYRRKRRDLLRGN